MSRTKPSAQSRQPVVAGRPCPANRTNKHDDPKVTITGQKSGYRLGLRECAMCGRLVEVRQHHGERWSAWYYAMHDAPTPEEKHAHEEDPR